MKVIVKKVRESENALKELTSMKMTAATAMRISLLMKSLQPAMQSFATAYDALLAEVGQPIAGTNEFKIKPEGRERFVKESEEILNMEIEVHGEPIPIAAFGNAEITPASLSALDWLISE